MGSSAVDEGGAVFEFVIVVVVVIVTVGWLRARDERPAGTSAPTPSGTALGGSATWSSTRTPVPADLEDGGGPFDGWGSGDDTALDGSDDDW
jgi:hypothetical protein